MIETIEAFYSLAKDKLQLFQTFANTHLQGLCVPDHIGYKCNSHQEFEFLRALIESESFFLYQSYISSRRITVFKLTTPFESSLGPISFLELSDQKPDGSQKSGFDHIEVVPTPPHHVDTLVPELSSRGVIFQKAERPHHTTWDVGLSPEFKLRLEPCPLIKKIKHQEMS